MPYALSNTAAAPSGPGAPTRLQSILINSTTLLLSWHAPDTECSSGILRDYYHTQIIDNSTGAQINYTTEDTHLLVDNLQPSHQYTFRVAVHTNGRGHVFSQPITVTLHSLQDGTYTTGNDHVSMLSKHNIVDKVEP